MPSSGMGHSPPPLGDWGDTAMSSDRFWLHATASILTAAPEPEDADMAEIHR